MLQKLLVFLTTLLSFYSLLISSAHSDEIKLHIPIVLDSPRLHIFYHELLETAIKETGHTPKFIIQKLPHLRAKRYLEKGLISIFWLIESAERNKKYIPIKTGLTNKLISKRIFFINKGSQHLYDKVKTIEDFRKLNLVCGMGQQWFDTKVWQSNNLLYKEKSGNWASIFLMTNSGRDFNYFPRGINEVIDESKQYPRLDIEERLVFIYDRDSLFYLSKTGVNAGAKYKDILENALQKARDSGLIERLVKKFWSDNIKSLNYNNRIKIHLKTPE